MIRREKNDVMLRHRARCGARSQWSPGNRFDVIIATLFFQPSYKIVVKGKFWKCVIPVVCVRTGKGM